MHAPGPILEHFSPGNGFVVPNSHLQSLPCLECTQIQAFWFFGARVRTSLPGFTAAKVWL